MNHVFIFQYHTMNTCYYKAIILLLLFNITELNNSQVFAQSPDKAATTIKDQTYDSKVFDKERHCRIFLPPGYEANPDKHYPVIYFFHGFAGRYNGPAEGEQSVSGEVRYYDEFNGNTARCGPDSLDNIAEYVRTHEVIVAKWDGYVEAQYPRPYDVGPVRDDIQFTDYFLEFVDYVDNNYRTIPTREGRAVSGLSMGGFMAMWMASKFPQLIGSASAFCPSAAFTVGPKDVQVYMPFEEMGRSYMGLPIRMHIGSKDFLRQYHYQMDEAFRGLDLFYESWQYGPNYAQGFHNAINFKGQFDFHMKYFRIPMAQPEKWYHMDVFPNFEVWGYAVQSERKTPGFTILEDVQKQGFKVRTRQWLPDGPDIAGLTLEIETDSIYTPGEEYQVAMVNLTGKEVKNRKVKADENGKLRLQTNGQATDIGIYRQNNPGYLSMADFYLDNRTPHYGEKVAFTPVLFNKGGKDVDSISVELITNTVDIEILSEPKIIRKVKAGTIHEESSFVIRSLDANLDKATLKLLLEYDGRSEVFWIETPFYSAERELTSFRVGDGSSFAQEKTDKENTFFGEGNGNGIIEPGEWVSLLTQPVAQNENWYGLRLYTDDPYVDPSKSRMKFHGRNDWSGAMRSTSEVYIKPECPAGHTIKFYGVYDYPNKGNIPRDRQGALSFIHEKKQVFLHVKVGQ